MSMSSAYYNLRASSMKTLIFNIWTDNKTSDVEQHRTVSSLKVVSAIYLLILSRRVFLFFVALKILMFVLEITKQTEFLQFMRCTSSFTRNRLRRMWNITFLHSHRYWLELCLLSKSIWRDKRSFISTFSYSTAQNDSRTSCIENAALWKVREFDKWCVISESWAVRSFLE